MLLRNSAFQVGCKSSEVRCRDSTICFFGGIIFKFHPYFAVSEDKGSGDGNPMLPIQYFLNYMCVCGG